MTMTKPNPERDVHKQRQIVYWRLLAASAAAR